MNRSWFVPLAVVVTCIPCLLIPLAAALIAAGAFSGVLGLLGMPWVLAIVAAVPVAAALIVLRLRRHATSCCDLPGSAKETDVRSDVLRDSPARPRQG
ncbi:MAG: hypothetical protein KJ048_00405 [Dehalococcoidia bacterium]|nr:hypothetical protein [Dehalococcoidia bacterium]MCZ7579165.1 hypothetical protein [Dehalococcoidia bacterium]